MLRTTWWAWPIRRVRARSWAGGVDVVLVVVFLVLVLNNLVISTGPLRAALAFSSALGRIGILMAIFGLTQTTE